MIGFEIGQEVGKGRMTGNIWDAFIDWMGDDISEFSIRTILEVFYCYCNPGDMKPQTAALDVLIDRRV